VPVSEKQRDSARHIAIFENTITDKLFGKLKAIAVEMILKKHRSVF
jgi:predicted LPLAT superfamily acyltransferase